jgi:hypothetical protein
MMKNKIFKNIVLVILIMVFIYIMIVLNMYKITKSFELNIFRYEDLTKLGIYALFCIPLAYILNLIFEKQKEKNEKNNIKNN